MIKKLIRRLLTVGRKKHDGTEPKVFGVKQHKIKPHLLSPNEVHVTSTLQQAGFKAFIVGGAVRDLIAGKQPKDFDIATNATPEQVKRLFRRAFIIGRRFQIVHVMLGQEQIEVTTFRGSAGHDAATDAHGRVLRDNTFGEQHEDAVRRDFTINAMYYDPATQTVLDYHGGVEDVQKKTLRMIGVPELRYREDPVRLLRVVRFAAKLQFTIDESTRAPIQIMAPLINNVPAARVLDEMLKLLTSGHAMACLQELRAQGLHHGLLPLLDVVLEQPLGEKFIRLALESTDARVREGKTISPSFLFAALLWHQVLEKWKAYEAAGELPIPALHCAADNVLDTQAEKLALQRKVTADMREIWAMQPRFEKRTGKAPYRLIEHERWRAAFDFLQLRCASGELESEVVQWWEDFLAADSAGREILLQVKKQQANGSAPPEKKRTRRRSQRGGRGGSAGRDQGKSGE